MPQLEQKMKKRLISLLISFSFVALILAPAIISLVEKGNETAIVLEINDEEDTKGQESVKDVEINFLFIDNNNFSSFLESKKRRNAGFYTEKYTSLYRKQTSPPPELS